MGLPPMQRRCRSLFPMVSLPPKVPGFRPRRWRRQAGALASSREWVSVAALRSPVEGSRSGTAVVFLSLGAGPARATIAATDGNHWLSKLAEPNEAISGLGLRGILAASLAEEVIRACRRDPREDAEAESALLAGLEAALYDLHRGPVATVHATLFGRRFDLALPYGRLASEAAGLAQRLTTWIGGLPTRAGIAPARFRVVAWARSPAFYRLISGWLRLSGRL